MKRSVRYWMTGAVATAVVLTCSLWTLAQEGSAKQQKPKDVFGMLRYLPGMWMGTGEGTPGTSEVAQRFKWILDQKFLFGRTTSVFKPTETHPRGEVHEDWMIFSHDSGRDKIILRQFHTEGYVTQYVLEDISDAGTTLRFVTESVESGPPGMRARLTFHVGQDKELEQEFELAPPGKDFSPCVSTRLKWKSGV
ncbi:MAG: hypothetical protein ACE5GE_09635 [Phycisphaerae bacterium]